VSSLTPLFLTRKAEHPPEIPDDLRDRFVPHPVGETMVTESCIACGQTWGIPGAEQTGHKGEISWEILRKHLAECWGSERRSRPRGERSASPSCT
jgi:hypothetical protein